MDNFIKNYQMLLVVILTSINSKSRKINPLLSDNLSIHTATSKVSFKEKSERNSPPKKTYGKHFKHKFLFINIYKYNFQHSIT